jgi:hypothetical protein
MRGAWFYVLRSTLYVFLKDSIPPNVNDKKLWTGVRGPRSN